MMEGYIKYGHAKFPIWQRPDLPHGEGASHPPRGPSAALLMDHRVNEMPPGAPPVRT